MDTSNLSKEFLSKLFSDGKRFDSRGLLDLAHVEISFDVSSKAEGSARVKLGKTEVIAGIKLSPGDPYPDSLDKGNLTVSGDLLPLASPRFELGPPGFDGIEGPRLIDRMIRESGMISLDKLVIKKGGKVWNVFIDVYPINDDGSLIDASAIACVAALKQAMLPELNDDLRIDYDKEAKEKLPLSNQLPLSFTFFKLGKNIILHPTREEEEACEGKVTFGISKWNGQYMIHSGQKGMASPFSAEEIGNIAKILPEKYEELCKKVNKFIK
ncbi:MAG: RNA-binding protein [Nanoarchaeota archaeon]